MISMLGDWTEETSASRLQISLEIWFSQCRIYDFCFSIGRYSHWSLLIASVDRLFLDSFISKPVDLQSSPLQKRAWLQCCACVCASFFFFFFLIRPTSIASGSDWPMPGWDRSDLAGLQQRKTATVHGKAFLHSHNYCVVQLCWWLSHFREIPTLSARNKTRVSNVTSQTLQSCCRAGRPLPPAIKSQSTVTNASQRHPAAASRSENTTMPPKTGDCEAVCQVRCYQNTVRPGLAGDLLTGNKTITWHSPVTVRGKMEEN